MTVSKSKKLVFFVSAASLMPLAARSDNGINSDPLWVENLSPVAGLVAFPAMRSAEVKAGWQVDVNTAVASHFALQTGEDESVFFDGETTRFSLSAEYGFAPDWSARITLPWVSHDEGFLDGTINSWHDFFGMNDNGRSDFPKDQFRYQYSGPESAFDLNEGTSGVGDVRAEVNYVLHRGAGRMATAALGYKFASGDEDEFHGSGGGDVFAAIRFSGKHMSGLPLTWHGQLGYTRAGSSDILGPEQRQDLMFVGLGFDWRIAENWSLLAQYDGHSAVVDSNLDATGEGGAAMLSFGTRWRFAREWALDLNVIEDIKVESAPDVTFQAAFRWRPES